MTNTIRSEIIAVTQTKWIRPPLVALALLASVAFVTGCGDSNNSGSNHMGNHDNHNK